MVIEADVIAIRRVYATGGRDAALVGLWRGHCYLGWWTVQAESWVRRAVAPLAQIGPDFPPRGSPVVPRQTKGPSRCRPSP